MGPRSLWAVFSTAFPLLLLAAAAEEVLDDPLAELLPEFPQAVRASTPAATSAAQLAVFLTCNLLRRAGRPTAPDISSTCRARDRFTPRGPVRPSGPRGRMEA